MQPFCALFNRILTLATVILVASTLATAGDVIAPTSLASVAKKNVLSPADEAAIAAFVELHAGQLEQGDAAARPKARLKLMADVYGLTGRRATPMFRELYAQELIPRLKIILAEGTAPRRISAAQVAGGLGTDSAVSLLSRHLTPSQESNDAVRVWTAASLRPLIAQANVTPTRLNRVIRNLGQAALTEPAWPVLRQQLETIAAASSNQRGDDGGQVSLMDLARAQQAAVVTRIVERLKNGDLDMLLVLEPHMRRVQEQFLDQDDADALKAQARGTVPALSGLYDAVLTNWDAIVANDQSARLAGRSLQKAEVMIVLMDNYLTDQSQSSAPQYENALTSLNRAPVEAGKAKWGDIGNGRVYQ